MAVLKHMTLNIHVFPHHSCLSSLKLMHNKRKLSTLREQILSPQKQFLLPLRSHFPGTATMSAAITFAGSLIAHQGMGAVVFPPHVAGIYIWKLNCLLEGFYSMQVLGNCLHPSTSVYVEWSWAEGASSSLQLLKTKPSLHCPEVKIKESFNIHHIKIDVSLGIWGLTCFTYLNTVFTVV